MALKTRNLIIIPARMGSSRFPGKPLKTIAGVPMLERVWRIAKKVTNSDEVLIATDSKEIKSFAENLGAKVAMTSDSAQTGMDRAAEVIKEEASDFEVIVTLQGDAVLTPPWVVQSLIELMNENPPCGLSTPAIKLTSKNLKDFIKLKKGGSSTGTCVVFDSDKRALYFSKNIIPHCRDLDSLTELHRHIGLYAYRRDTLLHLSSLPQARLELIEKLEQLRALENGIPIRVLEVDYRGRTHASVDNPEDIAVTEEIIKNEGELI